MKNWQVLSLIRARANVQMYASELREDYKGKNCNECLKNIIVCININFDGEI